MTEQRQPGMVAQVLALTCFKLLINTGRRFMYPFAPALSRGLDVPLTAVTSIIAASQFTSLVGIFSGPLADRFGYRQMMQAGLALLALGMLICGLVPLYWPVFFGLLLAAFGKTIFDPAIQAYIGRHVPFDRRGRIIGVVETAWAGSTLVGIPALGLIIEHVGLRVSFFTLALLGGISWLAISRLVASDPGSAVSDSQKRPSMFRLFSLLAKNRSALGMLVFGFFISLANDSLFVVYGAWFEQEFNVSIVLLGFSTIAIGSAELLGEASVALVSDRLGLKRSLVLGLCLAVVAYLLLPLIGSSLVSAMAGIFMIFLCFEFAIVTSFSLSTELVPTARATMMAGFYAASGIGRMIGVLVGGFIWQLGGISAVCWLAALCTFLGLVAIAWGLHGWTAKPPEA